MTGPLTAALTRALSGRDLEELGGAAAPGTDWHTRPRPLSASDGRRNDPPEGALNIRLFWCPNCTRHFSDSACDICGRVLTRNVNRPSQSIQHGPLRGAEEEQSR